ncbi:unnamed protein product [Linum tenue]|uniref:Fibronectin type-III domain-containing protein n=1 Tax=Linum tenue TaxID=586396 RepID=A0AAV0I100_9ROSI|nr:unnamed protein product [Linum tenue]
MLHLSQPQPFQPSPLITRRRKRVDCFPPSLTRDHLVQASFSLSFSPKTNNNKSEGELIPGLSLSASLDSRPRREKFFSLLLPFFVLGPWPAPHSETLDASAAASSSVIHSSLLPAVLQKLLSRPVGMDLDDKFREKVSGVQSLSSSVQSTPEKNVNSDDALRSPELIQEFLKSSGPKKELLRTCFDKDKKLSPSFKGKMTELKSLGSKTIKKLESKKTSPTTNNQPSKKQKRKGENPIRIIPAPDQSPNFVSSNSWICKNAACRAVLSIDDSFCKRCSCCICHSFDENKDPSLWLFCSSEAANEDSCGLSCHIECAFQHEKVGVVDHGQLMQLDGSYCCASCGKVSGIIESWKKQLTIAKDARRVDLLCYRIYLCYRLLDGTSRFKELHEPIKEAKAKLETEVGPLDGVSAKMARGIVSRLPIAADVHKLCTLATERADEWLGSASNVNSSCREGSLPAACRFFFEEVTASSVIIILIEMSASSSDDIKGYKLWYTKSREETPPKEPISVFPKTQRRILISNLQPCTEYTFRIVSYTESGDLGHSEAKCFTKSVEIFRKLPSSSSAAANGGTKDDNTNNEGGSTSKATTEGSSDLSGFRVRELGKIIRMAWAQERACSDGYCCDAADSAKPESTQDHELPASSSRQLDLNVMSVPDLNEELTPPFESSRDEDNDCTLEEHAVEAADDDAASHDNIKKGSLARSNGSGDSAPAVDSRGDNRKRPAPSQQHQRANEEVHDCDSTLINGSPFRPSRGSGSLDENFESCVKIIRWLECGGHIDQEFRLKLLTWFSLRSTEQERRVVHTFIRTMIDDPSSLAEQLIDSFSDIVSNKRPRNGFCSKLWH